MSYKNIFYLIFLGTFFFLFSINAQTTFLSRGDTIRILQKGSYKRTLAIFINLNEESIKYKENGNYYKINLQRIRKLEVARGVKYLTLHNAFIGGLGGGLIFGLISATKSSGFIDPGPEAKFIMGFIPGALIGSIIGYLSGNAKRITNWRNVSLKGINMY